MGALLRKLTLLAVGPERAFEGNRPCSQIGVDKFFMQTIPPSLDVGTTAEIHMHQNPVHHLELAEFVENGVECLHQVGYDGTILWANKAELELLGYAAEEYIGKNITEFHVDPPVIADILKRLTAGETLRNYEARVRCKNGEIRHVLIHSSARFENGKLLYTRCFSRDVSERVALRHVEWERDALLREAPVATALLMGPEHRFQLANDLYKTMVGRQQLEGRTYLEVFPELQDSDALAALDHAFATGEPFVAHEHRMLLDRTGSGQLEECFFKFNLQPITRGTGKVQGLMVVAVEVTDLVVARRLAETAKMEREALLAELKIAANAKDEFLAVLGHELRNPLAPIVTSLELMKRRGDLTSSREQAIIHRQVRHLTRLVDDLMDVSRITRGKVSLRIEAVELGPVLTKAVEMVNLLIEQRGHTLHTDFPNTGMLCKADPVRLTQVVSNLLTNAARYTPDGGQIHLKARCDNGFAVISVSDNGQGISSDVLPRVFDLFFQGTRKVHQAEGGLGVGLALVKSLIVAHSGSVHVDSGGPGLGSTFTVSIPLAASSQATDELVPMSMSSKGPSRKVLIVDDNQDAADLLADLMRMSGHEVRVAYEPATALTLASTFRPDVALLDVDLPVMDGYELAAQIRKEMGGATPAMYSLTGFGQTSDRERSVAQGLAGHFVKPVEIDRLLLTLATLPVAPS
ncbi:PAS domain-containing protein [Acidovorax sp. LjRoot129]